MTEPNSGNIVINVEPARLRVTPITFYLRARDFLDAAELLRNQSERFSPVAAFLYCRAIELALKAYLLARGDTAGRVKRFRHDLKRLLIDGYARGVDSIIEITPDERALLMRVSDDYTGNKLAYFDLSELFGRAAKRPDYEALAPVARKLVAAVKRGCNEAADGDWRPF